MAKSSDQGCTSVSNMENSPLPPVFVSLMKTEEQAKFRAGLFITRMDLFARQYSQGCGEILRQGGNETWGKVMREIATDMDAQVSSYITKLEEFRAKLRNGSVDQDNGGRSNDGPLPGDSPVGIQEELRDRLVKLQQQICDMESSNKAFQKRFEDATAHNAERVEEVTTLEKQLGEALESSRKLKDDLMQIPVRAVAATVDGSVQTYDNEFPAMCCQLDLEIFQLVKKYEEHEDSLEIVQEAGQQNPVGGIPKEGERVPNAVVIQPVLPAGPGDNIEDMKEGGQLQEAGQQNPVGGIPEEGEGVPNAAVIQPVLPAGPGDNQQDLNEPIHLAEGGEGMQHPGPNRTPYQWAAPAGYDFWDRIQGRQVRANATRNDFICEQSGDLSYLDPSWVSHVISYGGYQNEWFGFGHIQVLITEEEAAAICAKDPTSNRSMLTSVRAGMLHRSSGLAHDRAGSIDLDVSRHANPLYRSINFRGHGWIVYEALKELKRFLMTTLYAGFTVEDIRRSFAPRAPIHPSGIRPMILTVHFDEVVGDISFSTSYCCACFRLGHLPRSHDCRP